MSDYNYSSNSDRSRNEDTPERRPVKKVVQGNVTMQKRSFIRRALDSFIPEDVDNPAEYIALSVLWPVFKRGMYDIGTGVLNELFGYHDRRGNGGYYSYDKISRDPNEKRYQQRSPRDNDLDYESIKYPTRMDAESVLDGLDQMIRSYGTASIADLYDLAGIETENSCLNKYGWISPLRTAHAVPVRDHFVLRLPRAVPLD